MGNSQSEFEEQFTNLYRFVGIVQDRLFPHSKIYRKIKFNFDYMMVIERPVSEFVGVTAESMAAQQYLQQKLQQIRKYQNSYTVNLSYSMVIEGKSLGCQDSVVRLYLQYYNHTLNDYLSALRANRLHLTLEELIFVVASLSQGILVLRKMDIEGYWLNLDNAWVSADQGKVVVNPLYFIYESAVMGCRSQQMHQLSTQFQPVDLATSHSKVQNNSFTINVQSVDSIQTKNIFAVFLQLTRYLSPGGLHRANQLYRKMKGAKGVHELLPLLSTDCEQLKVDQFGQTREPQNLYARRTE